MQRMGQAHQRATARRPRRTLLRWGLWLLGSMLALLGLMGAAVLLVLAHLDARPIKAWVAGQASAALGVPVDYQVGRITPGGLELRGLRVAAPEAYRAITPDLVVIDAIQGRFTAIGMLFGDTPHIHDLVIRGAAIAIVVNEDGTTSLDPIAARFASDEPQPPTPLSQLTAELAKVDLRARVRIEQLALSVIRKVAGHPDQVLQLADLTARAEFDRGTATIDLDPVDVRVSFGDRGAVVSAEMTATLSTEHTGQVKLQLAVKHQNVAPELPSTMKLAAVDVALRFAPDAGTTEITVAELALADRALHASAKLRLTDQPGGRTAHTVDQMSARIDLEAIAALVPADIADVTISATPLEVSVRRLEPAPVPRLAHDGELRISGDIAVLDVAVANSALALRRLGIDVQATPSADGLALVASVPLGRLELTGRDGPARIPTRIEDAKATLRLTSGEPATADLSITAASLTTAAMRVRDLTASVAVRDARMGATPLSSSGQLTLTAAAAAVQAGQNAFKALKLELGSRWDGPKLSDLLLAIAADRAAMAPLPQGPLKVSIAAPEVVIDPDAPLRSETTATLAASLAMMQATARLAKRANDASWQVEADLRGVGPARRIELGSSGSVRLADLFIDHETTVTVTGVKQESVAVERGSVRLVSSGTADKHAGTLTARIDGPSSAAALLPPGLAINGQFAVDRRLPSGTVEATVSATSSADPTASMVDVARIQVSAEGKQGALRWTVAGALTAAGPLAGLLPADVRRQHAVDWDALALKVTGAGLVRNWERPAALTGSGQLTVELSELHYKGPNALAADVAALTLQVEGSLAERARRAQIDLSVPAFAAVASGVRIRGTGVRAALTADLAASGQATVDLAVAVADLSQSALPFYPVRDLQLTLNLKGDPARDLAVRAALKNRGGGTSLALTAQIDQVNSVEGVPGHRSLTASGSLEQNLGLLNAAPDKLQARGTIAIPFQVASGDLTVYHAEAHVAAAGVHLALTEPRVRLVQLDGSVPIAVNFALAADGVSLLAEAERVVYPRLRFGDHQPFLTGNSFVSLRELRLGNRVLGPLAGNVRIRHQTLALEQFEMVALGGTVAGQCVIELRGADTELQFRGKVTGIRPRGSDERLDAHASLTTAPLRRTVDGRVELVRIGKGHLRELIDLWDPYRENVAANRVRLGLNAGYPKRVTLRFSHGFATAAVTLGGLAKVVRIDEIRGVPVGPLVQRIVGTIVEE
jgi:translocation and assembly module TamB